MPFEDYNPTVMDHFLNPRNTGELSEPTHSAFVRNPVCGDQVKLTLRVKEGLVAEARVKVFGCAAAIAASSALTELLIGKSIADALKIRNTDVVGHLQGLPEYKIVCSVVAEDALKAAFA
jgi:NifU-like protein involved in Fe-S cluster formation